MPEIEVEFSEIVEVMKQEFPKEYTICVQKVYILKLEAMLPKEEVASNGRDG